MVLTPFNFWLYSSNRSLSRLAYLAILPSELDVSALWRARNGSASLAELSGTRAARINPMHRRAGQLERVELDASARIENTIALRVAGADERRPTVRRRRDRPVGKTSGLGHQNNPNDRRLAFCTAAPDQAPPTFAVADVP